MTEGRVLVVALIAGVLLLPALSDAATTERVRLVAADQRAARASVIVRSDLAAQSGWQGGISGGATFANGKSISQQRCGTHTPKLSTDVLTGGAASAFNSQDAETNDSTVFVLQNAAMAQDHWEQIAAPGYVMCELKLVPTQYKGMALESISTLPIPVGSRSYAARAILGLKGHLKSERIAEDVVYVGEGRTDAVVINSYLLLNNVQLKTELIKERHLTALMLKRATAHGA